MTRIARGLLCILRSRITRFMLISFLVAVILLSQIEDKPTPKKINPVLDEITQHRGMIGSRIQGISLEGNAYLILLDTLMPKPNQSHLWELKNIKLNTQIKQLGKIDITATHAVVDFQKDLIFVKSDLHGKTDKEDSFNASNVTINYKHSVLESKSAVMVKYSETQVKSGGVYMEYGNNQINFIKGVEVILPKNLKTSAGIIITSDEYQLDYQKDKNLYKGKFLINVHITYQKDSTISSDWAHYNHENNIITMGSEVKLYINGLTIIGNGLVFDVVKQTAKMTYVKKNSESGMLPSVVK